MNSGFTGELIRLTVLPDRLVSVSPVSSTLNAESRSLAVLVARIVTDVFPFVLMLWLIGTFVTDAPQPTRTARGRDDAQAATRRKQRRRLLHIASDIGPNSFSNWPRRGKYKQNGSTTL